MSTPSPGGRLGARIATVLRIGTLVAVAAIAAGFVVALVSPDPGPGPRPVVDLVAAGGPDAIVTLGLLMLTLLPLGVLGVAAATFAAERERRYLASSVGTLVLLVASLVAAALITGAS